MKNRNSITVVLARPRNLVAVAMLDRNGVFKPRRVERADTYKRKPKHKSKIYE